MLAYGPALFIWRKDGAHLTEEEKATLGTLVIRYTQKLKLENDEGKPCNPGVYGYDDYEPKALGMVLYGSYTWIEMPKELQIDTEKDNERTALKIGKAIEKELPGLYDFKSYYVEV